MSEVQQIVVVKQGSGLVAGVIAIVFAIIGILFFGIIFVPLAALVAIFGTIIAIKNRNIAGIGVNVLAWVLIIVGLISSPLLLASLGFVS